jgi:hypothetical protein
VLGDEEALRRGREEERQRLAAERLKEAYEELTKTDKARDMREQDLLRLEMQVGGWVGGGGVVVVVVQVYRSGCKT